MKAEVTFDYVLTHDTGRPKCDPQRNQRNYKVASVREVVEVRSESRWRDWLFGRTYSQELELTDNNDTSIAPLTIKARSKVELRDILKDIQEIADKESAARDLFASGDSTGFLFLGGGLLLMTAQEI